MLLGLAAAIASLTLIAKRDTKLATTTSHAQPTASDALRLPTAADHARAEKIARAYFAADGLEAKLQFVRNPARARPRMTDWYVTRGHSAAPRALKSPISGTGALIGTRSIPFVVLSSPSEIPTEPIVIAIDLSSETPKIDWESLVFYQPMPWTDFKHQRPKESVAFRVRATPSNDLLAPFDDPAKWFSLRLTSPNGIVGLVGYADQKSALGLTLKHLFQYGGKNQLRLIAHLRFPENDEGNPAVEITEASERWIESL